MKIKKYATALAVAVAFTGSTAVTVATPATAASASADFDSCDLSKKVDELKSWDAEGRYNILVWKDSALGSADLKGVVDQGAIDDQECGTVTGEDASYHWALFEEGTFTRTGDGGYLNWAFFGSFDRQDEVVDFHTRS